MYEPAQSFALRGMGLGTEVGFGHGSVGKGAAVTCSSHCGDISFHRGYLARAPRCVWETIGLCGASDSYTGCGVWRSAFLRRNTAKKMNICSWADDDMFNGSRTYDTCPMHLCSFSGYVFWCSGVLE